MDSNHGLQNDEVDPLVIAFPSPIDVEDPRGSHPSEPVLCHDVLPLHHLGWYVKGGKSAFMFLLSRFNAKGNTRQRMYGGEASLYAIVPSRNETFKVNYAVCPKGVPMRLRNSI